MLLIINTEVKMFQKYLIKCIANFKYAVLFSMLIEFNSKIKSKKSVQQVKQNEACKYNRKKTS